MTLVGWIDRDRLLFFVNSNYEPILPINLYCDYLTAKLMNSYLPKSRELDILRFNQINSQIKL